MNIEASHFVYDSESIATSLNKDFIARLPHCVTSRQQLFEVLQSELQLPDYFGHNWDALDECLRDFDWIFERKIIIFHEELPVLEKDSLRIYLEILADAVDFWELHPAHELVVVFPAKCKDACQEALSCGSL